MIGFVQRQNGKNSLKDLHVQCFYGVLNMNSDAQSLV
jgi:hypothetical protein